MNSKIKNWIGDYIYKQLPDYLFREWTEDIVVYKVYKRGILRKSTAWDFEGGVHIDGQLYRTKIKWT